MNAGATNSRDLLSFPLNVVTEVLLQATHCDNCIVAQSLDNLKWCHEPSLVNFLEHGVQFIASFFQNLRARGEVRKCIHI